MQFRDRWQGRPYYPISQFYKKRFGDRVFKLPISVAETCPNREGLRGMKTCNFCDVWGSAAYPEFRDEELRDQIRSVRARVMRRFNAKTFLVYFQAYTSTFSKVSRLRQQFEIATEFDDVRGFVVGTRPDCLSDSVFDLWNEYCEKDKFVAVELGVQTFDDVQLEWMRRGHSAKKSLQAVQRIQKNCPDVDLGIHLMFGLKGETDQQVIDTAKIVSDLGVQNVKLHNLHVLKNTPLEEDYLRGEFTPISQDDYANRIVLFLQHLDPSIAVHRLTATASRHEELVAPEWANQKMGSYQYVINRFQERDAYQGELFQTENSLPREVFKESPATL